MIKRVLLGTALLSALAGCGGATATGGVTKPSATAEVIRTANIHHLTRIAAPAPVSTTGPVAAAVTPAPPTVASTPVPAPAVASTPAATSTAAATSAPPTATLPPAATPSATPPPQRNQLTGPHGLNTLVGPDYTDCTGTSEVALASAQIYPCHTTGVLFIGHNQGVFTPLLSFVVGDVINWSDGAGGLHHLRVVAVRDVSSSVWPEVLGAYEFQTCLYPMLNSPMNRYLDAVEV